jgi:anti-sigma factor RsiW
MKSCRTNRQDIVLLAAGELDAGKAEQLRAHARTCADCARYLQEMSAISDALNTAATEPDLEVSVSFHSSVLRGLRSGEQASAWNWFEQLSGTEKWGLAAACLAALLILLSAVFSRTSQAPPRNVANNNVARHVESELAPTLSNYQIVANRSLDEFDGLLTRQANRALPHTPLYTPPSGSAGNGWD